MRRWLASASRLLLSVELGTGDLGTDSQRVSDALRSAASAQGAVVLADIGSSVLTVLAVLAELDPAQNGPVVLADAPFVEGAISRGSGSGQRCASRGRCPGGGRSTTMRSSERASRLVCSPEGRRCTHAQLDGLCQQRTTSRAIRITANGRQADAKSILEVLSLGAVGGTERS